MKTLLPAGGRQEPYVTLDVNAVTVKIEVTVGPVQNPVSNETKFRNSYQEVGAQIAQERCFTCLAFPGLDSACPVLAPFSTLPPSRPLVHLQQH